MRAAAIMVLVVVPMAVLAALGDATSRPKVEYREVEGRECLQPVVNSSEVRLADYRAAELRWLESKHPGVHVSRWDVALALGPPGSAGESETSTVARDTAHLDDVVGPDATVCFDVNVEESTPNPHDRVPPEATRR